MTYAVIRNHPEVLADKTDVRRGSVEMLGAKFRLTVNGGKVL